MRWVLSKHDINNKYGMHLCFELIDNSIADEDVVKKSMHRLRYLVFVIQLKWKEGIQVKNGLEFDEYDNNNAKYIVGKDAKGKVHASCRLIPTNCNYMLADKYPQAVTYRNIPKSDSIYEISRFCVSYSLIKESKGNAMGWLLAEAMRIGLELQLTHFISLTTDTVIPSIEKYSDWKPIPLGVLTKTGDDVSQALLFEINQSTIDNTIRKSLM